MITFILFAIFLPLSGWMGWKLHSAVTTDYKARWLEANKIIEADPVMLDMKRLQDLETEVKQLREEKQKQLNEPKNKEIALILSMSPEDRLALERKRLRQGWRPMDPLTGLPSEYILAMKKERMKQGWNG